MGLAFEEYRRAFDLTPYPRPALVTSEEEKMERWMYLEELAAKIAAQ